MFASCYLIYLFVFMFLYICMSALSMAVFFMNVSACVFVWPLSLSFHIWPASKHNLIFSSTHRQQHTFEGPTMNNLSTGLTYLGQGC